MRPPQIVSPFTVVDAFKPTRRRLNQDLVVAIVRALGVVGDTDVDAWRRACIRVHSQAKTGGPVGVYRQLPADLATFIGREDILKNLLHTATATTGDHARTVVVSAIEGMGGVGKTRLAVRAAHELVRSGDFGDVQMYVNLRGFDSDQPPADPAEVLDGFLRALEVPAQRIPSGLDERAAMFRDRMHGRKALVVLDNAASEEQVRSLIPAGPDCLVLITSRRSLTELDDAVLYRLDVFDPPESLGLLERIAGADRVRAEPEEAEAIVAFCGHLPLAVALAASQLRSRPAWSLEHLLDRLRSGRLDTLRAGGQSLQIVFDLSYQDLPEEARNLFRLLSLHPGEEYTAGSAAALAGIQEAESDRLLELLCDDHLLEQRVAGRYEMHDLLRAYAAERADADVPQAQRTEAVSRVLTWYLHSADAATQILAPSSRETLTPPEVDIRPSTFTQHADALAWCEIERTTLVAAVLAAGDASLGAMCWRLAIVLSRFFNLRGYWTDWETSVRAGLAAARAEEDVQGEARMLNSLGRIDTDLRRYPEALGHYRLALTHFRRSGDVSGESITLLNLGGLHGHTGDYAASVECLQQALPMLLRAGETLRAAAVMTNLARTLVELGDLDQARALAEEALVVRRQNGDAVGVGISLAVIAIALQRLGRPEESLEHLREAWQLSTDHGDRRRAAEFMTLMADALDDCGDHDAAEDKRRAAREVFEDLGDPQQADLPAR